MVRDSAKICYLTGQPGHPRHLDTAGGFLYGTFTLNLSTGAVTNGKVTGETGAFTGAIGTIRARTISSARHAVTITCST